MTVDENELRELVEQWRAKQEWHRKRAVKEGGGGSRQWQSFKECADELEQVLQE